jgi:uncharacterized protein (TIGR00266 family)
MKYELQGKDLPVLILNLDKGETIVTEKGAMSWMSETLEMKTNAGKGAFGRMFSGESIFQNTFTATKDGDFLAISSSFPGQILAFDVSEKGIIVQKRAFLARESKVEMNIFFQKKLGAGFFGGEGFIMQHFKGNGYVFLEIDGSLTEYDLKPGETIVLDTGYLAAMEETVKFDVITVKGAGNVLFGGEGIFNTKVTGPGKIWIQSMPINKLVSVLGINQN